MQINVMSHLCMSIIDDIYIRRLAADQNLNKDTHIV